MKYRSDLERFHGAINDPVKRAKEDYSEIVAMYGTPLLVISDKSWPSAFVGCVYIESEDPDESTTTYRIQYCAFDEDSFAVTIPSWYGGERLSTVLRVATADNCDWDESDERWVSAFNDFVVLPGDVDFDVEYAA